MILSDKHSVLQRQFREFAEREFTAELLTRLDETGAFDRDIYNKLAEAGFMGLTLPVKYGGQGADTLSHVLLMEELARVSPVLSIYINSANTLGSGPLLACANEAQLAEYLPAVASGKSMLAFCLTEADAGSDAGGITTAAVDCGDYYLLNGRKRFVSGAPMADYALVFARTDPAQRGNRGISLFLVDMKLDGIALGTHEDKMGMRGFPTCDIVFSDVHVPKTCLVGPLHAGFAAAMKTLDGGRLAIAAQALGIAQGCLDEAVAYAKKREQFGSAIGKFEGVGFMLAEMATEIQAARELVYATAVLKDSGSEESASRCAMAKYYAAEVCNRAAYKAMQIFGGYGYIRGSKVERLYRDARVTSIYEGTSQIQQLVIARRLLKDAPPPAVNSAAKLNANGVPTDLSQIAAELRKRASAPGSEVVIALGMGIKNDAPRAVKLAWELADVLHGTLGCTRDVADAGYMPLSLVIGQTGKTVHPAVYIALGVSGAASHVCGVKSPGYVLSVNIDETAPISKLAHATLTADLFDALPALLSAVKGE